MNRSFDKDMMGKVCLSVYLHHNSSDITYRLGQEAQDHFDKIIDNLATQFNFHYDQTEELTESQPPLDEEQRAEIEVRTKAAELMGRLCCVLWIYSNGRILFKGGLYEWLAKAIGIDDIAMLS